METTKPSWGKLGVVDTIYEEEDPDRRSSSSSPSGSLSSSPTPLHSRIEAWTADTGRKSDVLIHVQGRSFHLHKDPLTSRSIYLKRKLTDKHEITLSPPLKITAESFSLVADFCYGAHVSLTPFNVAAIWLAAEFLQMTVGEGDENLKQITESYFRRFLAVNGEYALIVFKSCLALLPEAETAGSMVSRCVEALCLAEDGAGIEGCLDDILSLRAEDFRIVAEAMNQRFSRHDVLYRIVDFYLEEQDGKITEAEKTQICNTVDCNKLSPQILLHVVQNPRMPLRFIVRAMLVEQLNTRRSIYSAANRQTSPIQIQHHRKPSRSGDATTLGAILQRDAAVRQNAKLNAVMTATSSRIEDLENQLQGMKKLLKDSEQKTENSRKVLDSGRSISFHFESGNKIERVKAPSSFRFTDREQRNSNSVENSDTPRMKKNLGQWFKGIKSALWKSKNEGLKNGKGSGNESMRRNQRCSVVDEENVSPPSIWDFD